MTKKNILFVSDSLGTPIHARGIFNFSYGIVQILADLGLEIDLLMEPPHGGVFDHVIANGTADLTSIQKVALLTDVYRHFHGDRFRFDWHYPNSAFQRLCDQHGDLAAIQFGIEDGRRVRSQQRIVVDKAIVAEFTSTSHTKHLNLFDGMLLSNSVYAESFRRAIHGLPPVIVDAANYDYVFVDTPHAIDFVNIDPARIIFVVHDVIPLFEITMGFDWREMFVNKLSATAKEKRNGIFVSETTRAYFNGLYETLELSTSTIVYPPVRKEVVAAAELYGRRETSDYIAGIAGNKEVEFAKYALAHAPAATTQTADEKRWRSGRVAPAAPSVSAPRWDGSLPYFCSVLSDEPRKNITVLVEASKQLVGRANIVIMGQIDGDVHMGRKPELHPNLHFTGYVSEPQKFDLLSGCEAFIFPSFSEGFGIPIIEAALFGAPIICSDIPVFREVTNGLASFFDPASPPTLVEKIEAVLHDPAARNGGGELRRFAHQQFVQDSLKSRMVELFQQIGE